MSDLEFESEEINKFLDSVLMEAVSKSQYVISGSGWGWFLDPDTHEFVRIVRGTEILPLPGDCDDRERVLVRTPYRFLLIPENEVQEIGWN